jgi:hypothetical protein
VAAEGRRPLLNGRSIFWCSEKEKVTEAVSHAIATIERLGWETGLWTTAILTYTEVLTKKKLEYNAKNLNDFDAVLFYTGGELEMNPEEGETFLFGRWYGRKSTCLEVDGLRPVA